MLRRSRLVSTKTSGPVSTATGVGRSRGECAAGASAAIAACTAATRAGSEFTHCSPDVWAMARRLSMGKAYSETFGMEATGTVDSGLAGATESSLAGTGVGAAMAVAGVSGATGLADSRGAACACATARSTGASGTGALADGERAG